MPDPNPAPAPAAPRKKRSWLRWLLIAVGLFLVLLVAGFFILTSSGFVKSVILPKVSSSLNAKITAGDASIHPFSQIVLRDVRIETFGPEPLVQASELRLRYNLSSLLNGKNEIHELALVNPAIYLFAETNGTRNFDPILQALNKPKPEKKPSEKQKSTRVDLRNVSLQNGKITCLQKMPNGSAQTEQLQNVQLALDHLQNGAPGKLILSSDFQHQLSGGPASTNRAGDLLAGKLNGAFEFSMSPELQPLSAKGDATLALNQAAGAYQDYANYRASLAVDLTPAEIKQLALRFQRQGTALGELAVSGPFDPQKLTGQLNVQIKSIDRQILNMFGAARGWDFADSTLNSTNLVNLSSNATAIAVSGQLQGRQISIHQQTQSTPVLNLDLQYDVTVDTQNKMALLRQINVTGRQNQADLIRASLDKPMNLSWGQGSPAFEQSSFDLVLTNLNLADWKMVLGTNSPAGTVGLKLRLIAQQNGKILNTDLAGQIQNLALPAASASSLQPANLQFQANGQLADLKRLDLPKLQIAWLQNQAPIAQVAGSVRADLSTKNAAVQATVDGQLPALAQQLALTNLTAEKGSVHVEASVAQTNSLQTAAGQFQLAGFTGRYGQSQFQDYSVQGKFDVQQDHQDITISQASLALQQGAQSGGQLDLNGKFNTGSKAGQFDFKAAQINQAALAPFLASSLGDKKLLSIALNGSGSASLNPAGDSSLKASLAVTNLLFQDPAHPSLNTPLSVALDVDGAMKEKLVDLRQCSLALAPTDRSPNKLQLQAKLDLSTNKPGPSQITIRSQSLDVTPYYDLFAGNKKTNATPQAPPPSANPPSEPAPVHLPFQDLTADAKIDRLILRALDASNVVAVAKMQQDKITIDPLQLLVNGAPVQLKSVVDVSVPGYKYDLSFSANNVPLDPLADTFSTYTNQLGGNLVAQGQIQGAGTTGTSLQKSLNGQASLVLTNLNLQIVGPKVRRLLEPIALILRLPELTQTPINWVNSQLALGNGEIRLSQFAVQSGAFYAQSQGAIPIAPVLTNSPLNLPVEFSLRRSLAAKVHLIPPGAPTNTAYVQLPTFVHLTGTLGDPKSDINKLVISELLLRSASGIPQLKGDAGKIIGNVTDVLSGQGGTNASRPFNPLDVLQGFSKARTNPPPAGQTNPPAAKSNTNRLNPLDIFKLIPQK